MGNAGGQHDRVMSGREGKRPTKVQLVWQFLKGAESTIVLEYSVCVPFRISSGAARVESSDGLRFEALEWITACLRLLVSFSFRRALSHFTRFFGFGCIGGLLAAR